MTKAWRSNCYLYGCRRQGGIAETRDRTGDLEIFSLTLSQLSYRGNKPLKMTKL